jgi:hypothetical protein
MNRSETIRIDGRAIGEIVQANDGAFCFLPREGYEKSPTKPWANVDEMKVMLQKLYGGPAHAHK